MINGLIARRVRIHYFVKILSVTILLSICSVATAQQTFVTTGDTYVRDGSANNNYGTASVLQVQGHSDRTALLRFDLSSISGSTATSAFLELSVDSVGNPPIVEVRKILDNWNETTVTYATKPTLDSISTTFSPSASDVGNVISVDVTAVVNELLANPSTDYGFALKPDGGKAYFDSREVGPAPQLVITTSGGQSNVAPVVDAGTNFGATVSVAASLDGTVSDDGLPNPPATVTSTWSLVSGPGNATFGDVNDPDSSVTFDTEGSYVLRLSADDSLLTDTDDVTVTVSVASSQLSFDVVGDSYTRTNQTNDNYGGSAVLQVQSSDTRTAFLEFNLSSFPNGATATTAFLELSVDDVGNPPTVEVRKILGSWSEMAITYGNQPTLGSVSTTFSAAAADEGNVISVDVTNVVNELLADPASDFGIALFPDGGKLYLDSRETGFPARIVATPSGSGSNNPPIARSDMFTVSENSSANQLAVLLDNGSGADSDPDLDQLSVSSVVSPGSDGGTITIDGTSTLLLYTPATDFTGVETFDYTLSDGQSGFDSATVSVTVNSNTGGSGPFLADGNGQVVMEAENYDLEETFSGATWTPYSGAGYVGASAMQATPDVGLATTSSLNSTSPRMDYQVQFTQATDVYVWVRGLGPSGGSNSVWAGVDGDDSDVRQINLSTSGGYVWKQNNTKITVPAGVHTINIWSREDGSVIDRIILEASTSTPSGDGPPESPRSGSSGNGAPTVDAGSNQSITLPDDANLSGTATDDGLPNPPGSTTNIWDLVSGPGSVTFGNASNTSTTASFSVAGTYVLRLTADDSEISTDDTVTITVSDSGGGGGGGGGGPASVTYEYDALGRLIEAYDSISGSLEYEYDSAGNRKQVTETAATQ